MKNLIKEMDKLDSWQLSIAAIIILIVLKERELKTKEQKKVN